MEIILYLGATGALLNFVLQMVWFIDYKRSKPQ